MPTIAELAWAAGAMDCDGHIGIVRQPPNPKRRETTPRYIAALTIGNTILSVPEKFLEIFDVGTVCYRKTPNGTDMAQWQARNGLAEEVLTQIAPFLVGKKEQAELVLDLRKSFLIRTRPVSSEILNIREKLYLQSRLLSMKGRWDLSPDLK